MADYRSSIRYLKRVDPILAGIIEAVGACRIQIRSEGTHFQALVRAIVYQQLSGKPCGDNSQDTIYLASLSKVSSYAVENGQLQLKFANDGGKMDFKNGGKAQ